MQVLLVLSHPPYDDPGDRETRLIDGLEAAGVQAAVIGEFTEDIPGRLVVE